jgi:type IV pilus assembly protein PilF
MNVRHLPVYGLLALLLVNAACVSTDASKRASYHYQMGLSYLGEDNATGALVEFTQAEKFDPDNPELQNNLGLAYFRKNRYDLAEQKFLRAIDLKPEFTEARNNLGLNYLRMKRWDDAILQFKLVTEDIFYQNQEMAYVNLGIAYLDKGEYPKALATLRSAVSSYPRNPIARVYLGKAYFTLDKVDQAIGEYRKAVELDKEYANAHYQLALAYLKVKDNRAALISFKEVLRIAPNSDIGRLSREYIELLR